MKTFIKNNATIVDPNFNLRSPNFKSGPPVIKGSKVPHFSLSILNMIPWNSPNGEQDEGDTFEFDQLYKQPESKMQVTGKISNNNIKSVWLWECSGK